MQRALVLAVCCSACDAEEPEGPPFCEIETVEARGRVRGGIVIAGNRDVILESDPELAVRTCEERVVLGENLEVVERQPYPFATSPSIDDARSERALVRDTLGRYFVWHAEELADDESSQRLAAYDSDGTERWAHDLGTFPALGLERPAIVTASEGVYVRGSDTTDRIRAFTRDGALRWVVAPGDVFVPDGAGGLYSAYGEVAPDVADAAITHIDANGMEDARLMLQSRNPGEQGRVQINDIAVHDRGIVVVGSFDRELDLGNGTVFTSTSKVRHASFLLWIENGAIVWAAQTPVDVAYVSANVEGDAVLVGGTFGELLDGRDTFVSRVTSDGVETRLVTANGFGLQSFRGVARRPSGALVVVIAPRSDRLADRATELVIDDETFPAPAPDATYVVELAP